MDKKVKIGLVGLGSRGTAWLHDNLVEMDDVSVVAVCDVYEDRMENAAKIIEDKGQPRPVLYADYHDLVVAPEVEAVFICCAWEMHVPIAIAAMEAKKITALEVGGAYSEQDCLDLVAAYERTRTPFMFMENCCYGKRELMVLNMVRAGAFGEIVHCHGAYAHDLREEIAYGKENRHYRLRNYIHRNCENYPTHELGPIAKILNINRGNRMVSLSAVASKARGMAHYIREHKSDDAELMNTTFMQGDIINTTIKCADGSTITLTLDTTLPRAYCREFTVHGTMGMYSEESDSVFIDGKTQHEWEMKPLWGNADAYEDEYLSPAWQDYKQNGIKGTHGGMDWLLFRDFIRCIQENQEFPMDVYDAAAWMCITYLSEESIANGGIPVAVPDFTHGAWTMREPLDVNA